MGYTLMPFRFMRLSKNDVFLSTETGEYIFIDNQTFDDLINDRLTKDNPFFDLLEARQFLATGNIEDVIALAALKYRSKKAFLQNFTELHMVVPTLRCNSSCIYCQVARKRLDDTGYNMNYKTADNVIKTIFSSPSQSIKIEFQGGDPSANFEMVRYLTEKAEVTNILKKKNLDFVICTNTTLLGQKEIQYLKKHNIQVSTSLDGPKSLHNKNRPLQSKQDTYEIVQQKMQEIKNIFGDEHCVSALMTASSYSLGHFREIIDEYLKCGFCSIFLRPLNPYGFAKNYREKVAYPIEKFLKDYFDALDYIIEINRKGTFFVEGYASILLSRILTPFSTGFVDLQSPAGVGIACALYDYDGSVYVSDEGRMLSRFKDYFFRIGNVNENTYQEMFNGQKMHEVIHNSCVETLPGCAYCAFAPYCGADPVRNYSEQGSMIGFRPDNEMCKKNKAIIKYLLTLIKKDDPEINRILWSWIR